MCWRGWSVGDRILDLYEVTGVLGRGGMGVVHRVRHLTWDIDLAVKSPLPEVFRSQADRERFVHKAQTWVSLGLHPHVCACRYVLTIDGIPNVFAEYLPGGSLRGWIADRRLYRGMQAQGLARVLDMAIQLAWGLGHVHDHGLVHLDVQPANVLLDGDGTAKIIGFGLAKARAAISESYGTTEEGARILVSAGGLTSAYASPERTAGAGVGRRSDVWSYAVSVLEMFVGGVAWREGPAAGAELEYYRRNPGGQAVPLPPPIADLLARCLRRDSADRPRSMREIADELIGVHERLTGRPYPRPAPRAARLRADELNNRALSLLELGRAEEGEAAFEQALFVDPRHPEATYNLGLRRWRTGRLPDDAFLREVDAVGARELLARARRERAGGLRRVLAGHRGVVYAVSLSADGGIAASAGADGSVRLWEVASGHRLHAVTLEAAAEVMELCLSADGRVVLGTLWNQDLVRVWDLDTGRRLRDLVPERAGVTGAIKTLGLSGDGRLALTGDGDTSVRLWEVTTGECLRVLRGHTGGVGSTGLGANGRIAISGGDGFTRKQDSTVRVWEPATGRCLQVLEGHTGTVSAVGLSDDGRLAVSGSWDETLRVWDVRSGHCLRTLHGHSGRVTSVGISREGRLVLSGSFDGTVRLWHVVTGRCLRTFDEHTDRVYAVSLSADGLLALSADQTGTVHLNELAFETYLAPFEPCRPRSHTELIQLEGRAATLVREGERALVEGRLADARAALSRVRSQPGHERSPQVREAWNRLARVSERVGVKAAWQTGTLEGHRSRTSSACLSADGRQALSGGDDRVLRLWDVGTGRCLRTLDGHLERVHAVSMSADGRLAVSASGDDITLQDCNVRLWEPDSGRCLRVLEGHTSEVLAVAMTPDGRLALSGSQDSTLRLWDLGTGRCVRVLQGPYPCRIGAVCLTPDGHLGLSGSRHDRAVRVWDLDSGDCLHVLQAHTGEVTAVDVTADGRLAVSAGGYANGGGDATLRVWDLQTGRCLRVLNGHTGPVHSVRLTADSRFALSGGEDHTVRLWELSSGRCLQVLQGHAGAAVSVDVSVDGFVALSAGAYDLHGNDDHTLRLWEIDWDL